MLCHDGPEFNRSTTIRTFIQDNAYLVRKNDVQLCSKIHDRHAVAHKAVVYPILPCEHVLDTEWMARTRCRLDMVPILP